MGALMKVREWSELVAGPKWKTFIRRFNRNPNRFHGGSAGAGGRIGSSRFQYDPLSYAMNFDEGGGGDGGDDGGFAGYRNFSARYAAAPLSTKASMDLDSRDLTPLFEDSGSSSAAKDGGRH